MEQNNTSMLKFNYTFLSPIKFSCLDNFGPDDYYMQKCSFLINFIFDKDKNKIEQIDGGAGGGQGSSFIWLSFEYFEDNVNKEFILSVSNDGNEINIKIDYEKSNLMEKYINNLEEKLKDKFLCDQTIFTKKIYTQKKDINSNYYDILVKKIFNYFDNIDNCHLINSLSENQLWENKYIKKYNINNYEVEIKIISTEGIIYIFINGFKNNLDKIGFNIKEFENFIKIILKI
jgi:hypothetical protein